MLYYQVSVSGMQQHIGANESSEAFDTLEQAIDAFESLCDRFGYTNSETRGGGNRVAGGVGHDYRIELEIISI